MLFSKKWLKNHPQFLLHFLIHIDVLMLCRKFLNNIKNVYEKNIKMENSLLAIFDEIWPMTLYYSTGCLSRFLSIFKNS